MLPNPLATSIALLAALASTTAVAASPSYSLYHRLVPASTSSPAPWSLRASLQFDAPQGFPEAVLDSKQSVAELLKGVDGDYKESLKEQRYQLALVQEGQTLQNQEVGEIAGQVVNVKACLLPSLLPGSYSSDILTLSLSSNTSSASLQSFSYDIVGILKDPQTGCPIYPIPKRGGGLKSKEVQLKTVLILPQVLPDVSALRIPPPPRTDGTTGAQEPPREKSFIEKYWFYILPVLVLMALPSGDGATTGETGEASMGAGARQIKS